MRSIVLGVALLAGCASTTRARDGVAHDGRAAALQAHGRYEAAAREREAADRQLSGAADRAQLEAVSPVLPPLFE